MKTYIHLGRTGDLLTLLPLLKNAPERCALMVSKDYAQVLEGVSYVDPVIYDGPAYEMGKAVEQAEAEGRDWVCTQINGPKEAVAEFVYKRAGQEVARTTSFQKEMFRVCGRLNEWDNNYALEFDRRDHEREDKLRKLIKPKKKYVLVALDGISSPFPYKALVLELLKHCGYAVLDISTVKAERIYDLLALYEHPQVMSLLAIDSAPLQLARAAKLPVLALANDSPLLWNGSSWRPNHWWYCRYRDFPLRAVEMLDAIKEVARFRYKTFDGARAIHFWNAYEGEHCQRPAEWFVPLPITIGSCGRDSASHLKDPKRLPYLKDALRMAMQKADPNDWVCLTRPKVEFKPLEINKLASLDAAFAYRIATKDGQETFFPIGDMFWAKRGFWKEVLPEIPDLILGGDYFWSHTLTALFRVKGARDATGTVYT